MTRRFCYDLAAVNVVTSAMICIDSWRRRGSRHRVKQIRNITMATWQWEVRVTRVIRCESTGACVIVQMARVMRCARRDAIRWHVSWDVKHKCVRHRVDVDVHMYILVNWCSTKTLYSRWKCVGFVIYMLQATTSKSVKSRAMSVWKSRNILENMNRLC